MSPSHILLLSPWESLEFNLTLKQTHIFLNFFLKHNDAKSLKRSTTLAGKMESQVQKGFPALPRARQDSILQALLVKVFSDQICICTGAEEIGETRTVICLGMLNDPL